MFPNNSDWHLISDPSPRRKCTHPSVAPWMTEKRPEGWVLGTYCPTCTMTFRQPLYIAGTVIPYTRWNLLQHMILHPIRFWRNR